jgi:hypothetical protein
MFTVFIEHFLYFCVIKHTAPIYCSIVALGKHFVEDFIQSIPVIAAKRFLRKMIVVNNDINPLLRLRMDYVARIGAIGTHIYTNFDQRAIG